MDIAQAQADVRRIYSNGWRGPAVSAVVWLVAAVLTDNVGIGLGAAVLFVGGALLIFPLNLLFNKLSTGQADLPAGHPMRGLAVQVAMNMVAALLAAWAISTVLPSAFFPLAMVVAGAHYLPFAHLYGERFFLVAAIVETVAGLLILVNDTSVSLGGYVMAALLAAQAVGLFLRHRSRRESPAPATTWAPRPRRATAPRRDGSPTGPCAPPGAPPPPGVSRSPSNTRSRCR